MATNIITMNRGDTYEFTIDISDLGNAECEYKLTEDDALYVGIMDPNQPFEHALIKKRYDVEDADPITGDVTVVIEPEDTIDLLPGRYYYAVKLHMQHREYSPEGLFTGKYIDKVITVINKTKFVIYD